MAEASSKYGPAVALTKREVNDEESLQERLRRMEGLLESIAFDGRRVFETVEKLARAGGPSVFASRLHDSNFMETVEQAPFPLVKPRHSNDEGKHSVNDEAANNDAKCSHGMAYNTRGKEEPSPKSGIAENMNPSEADSFRGERPATPSRHRLDLDTIVRGLHRGHASETPRIQIASKQLLSQIINLFTFTEPRRKGMLNDCIRSSGFGNLCGSVIILNALFVSYTSDLQMKRPGLPKGTVVDAIEVFFVIFYTIELLMRLVNHRLYFFVNHDFKWNTFDFILVVASLFDAFVTYIVPLGISGNNNVSFMRLCRLLKMAKLLRTLRVMKVFRDLAVIFESFSGCLISLFWSFILMVLFIYLFALIFVQGLAGYVSLGVERGATDDHDQIKELFGSTVKSMLSLYMAVSGGDDWANYYAVVAKAGSIYAVLWLCYTFAFAFALINILTGVFVEKAVAAAQPERDEIILQQRRKNLEDAAEFRHICELLDTDRTGTISRAELHDSMENELMVSYLDAKGLQLKDVDLFFHMIASTAGIPSGEDPMDVKVGIDEFVSGCMAMKGFATSYDVTSQGFQLHTLTLMFKVFEDSVMRRFDGITAEMTRWQNNIRAERPLLQDSTRTSTTQEFKGRDRFSSL